MKSKSGFFYVLSVFFLLFTCFVGISATKPKFFKKTTLKQKNKTLQLYVNPCCPYCSKVLLFIKKNHISLEIKDVRNPLVKKELIEIGKKSQVPCLVINYKQALYESDDIIEYLKKS